MDINLSIAKIEPGNRASLLAELSNLSDCDFNGENGLEYLAPEVWDANGYKDYLDYKNKTGKETSLRYSCNLDFYMEKIEGIENDEECIEAFVKYLVSTASNYYTDYKIEYIKNDADEIVTFAVAMLING